MSPGVTVQPDKPLVAIVGPTASGKSALAMTLAQTFDAEIVSCDSLQVYRGLDVGSAKPTATECARVRHHLLDVADPDETFSAARYAQLARAALAEVSRRERLAVVAGGTGLYLRALLIGLFDGPGRDASFRRRMEAAAMATTRGNARLHRILKRLDPRTATRIHSNDRLRIIRALEVFHLTHRALSEHFDNPARALTGYATLTVGLALERALLRERVERRTDDMLAAGLIDEVAGLLGKGYGAHLRPLQAIGYRQAVGVVQGALSVAAARHDIVVQTMRYAKRQMTWFRHQAEVSWFPDAGTARAAIEPWLALRGAGR